MCVVAKAKAGTVVVGSSGDGGFGGTRLWLCMILFLLLRCVFVG